MQGKEQQGVVDRELITGAQTAEVSRCRLTALTEEQFAHLSARRGVAVYSHKGRFWRNSDRFGALLLVPIHWMAELTAEQAVIPRWHALGIKSRIDDASQNNGYFNLYVIEPPEAYGFDRIRSLTRGKIRKACREGVVIDLATAALLEEQGYEMTRAALQRSGYRKPPTKKDYVRRLQEDTFLGGNRLVLAGLVPTEQGLRLGALAAGSAVDGTAYGDDLYLAPWARKSNVGPLLVYSFIEACQRSKGVERIVLGRATSDQALEAFKATMGIPKKDIPARVVFRTGVRPAVEILVARDPRLNWRLYGY
jgi:hypothetical protein